ncbi:hypothetical protein GZ22_18555 (plasmid) [Terribacillus saccharophilus]|uniref:Uncharacterized protein n=1 Tax=Terribacillus saccharophilus TaxID=361277 RepID=A0A075LR01_9BACI|nr:hypothetical protein [Terribacillus goriensis]AIF68427.1 hypothetical protein GZ22_18555 [Terribacillus goriensis]
MIAEEVLDVDKGRVETIKLLKENIAESKATVRKPELRHFLFYAVYRGMPLSIRNITSNFLAGHHDKQNVMPYLIMF